MATTTEDRNRIKIDSDGRVHSVVFSTNGKYLLGGGTNGVTAWRVEDGKRMATMQTRGFISEITVSKDGRYIAAGTDLCYVHIWDAETYEIVFEQKESSVVNGVDFSPDAPRIVSALDNKTASIWDIITSPSPNSFIVSSHRAQTSQAQILQHESSVVAAKYSPQGDRIATGTAKSVRIYDSDDARLLVEVNIAVYPFYNTGLLWTTDDHLFVVSCGEIMKIEPETGSPVKEWTFPGITAETCIALPKHEEFIAYSVYRTVLFWDAALLNRLGVIQHHHGDIISIAFSPDDRFLAIGSHRGTVILESLSHVVATREQAQGKHPLTLAGYMHLLLGNSHMESSDYEGAIEPFGHTTTQMQHDASQAPSSISLISGCNFDTLRSTVQQRLCESLYAAGRTEDSVKCFHDMTSGLPMETKLGDKYLEWAQEFRQRACKKIEHLGDAAANVQQHDEAISLYTVALSLHLLSPPEGILIKRANAYMATGRWEQALDDANQTIILNPSSPWGYKIKHAAFHQAGDHDNAVDAFETMLSKMEQSSDPDIRQRRNQYKTLSKIRTRIRRIVERTLRDSPHVLINTTTGRLCYRAERASAFESLPIFKELVSSMTTRIDRARIKREVRQFFQYVMLSHKWEDNEPLFEQVIHIAVYDLDGSPTHDKLHMFCKIAREAGFNWAWSDTCCINTGKQEIHQEALVAMFKWYRGSALVIVFLRGVGSTSQLGALAGSIWNTRGWTLQEYIAAKVIHFYTEDWTPYLNLQLANHKESPEVISEMEQATGVSSKQLVALRPGLTSIREKLRLASTRRTERVEDVAYSLLGIFSVTGINAIYGEGEAALGRLLSHVLSGSGDVSILAWTGESGGFNSCLPARISVFNGPPTSHLPSPIPDEEMERIVIASYTSFDLDVALRLYDRLKELPAPWFAANRMKLPCIAFRLPPLFPRRTRSGRVYCADTVPFGMVEIKTRQNLSRMRSLYLVHPWLDSLLEQVHTQSDTSVRDYVAPPRSLSAHDEEIPDGEPDDEEASGGESDDESASPVDSEPEPQHSTLVDAAPMDRETRARRFAVRLRQPFGALLVTSVDTGRGVLDCRDCRRVAADGLITVAFQDHVSLRDILDNVQTLDVL